MARQPQCRRTRTSRRPALEALESRSLMTVGSGMVMGPVGSSPAPMLGPIAVSATPAAPTLSPSDDTGRLGDGRTTVRRPHFTGTATAGGSVDLLDPAGNVLGSAPVSASGGYTVQPAVALGNGTEALRVRVRDASGNLGPAGPALSLTVSDAPAGDLDGDGKTEVALFRPSTAQWIGSFSTGGSFSGGFGDPAHHDVPVPADYDGIGRSELAVYRPATGQWLISGPNGLRIVQFGDGGQHDVAVPGDYDNVGHAELAVYRPSTAQWLIASPNGLRVVQFGDPANHDIPVQADYDGTGHTEFALFRPASARWLIASPGGLRIVQFGETNLADVPAPGDYDGTGRAELAVFRPNTGQWIINGTAGLRIFNYGARGLVDVPVDAPIGSLTLPTFVPSTPLLAPLPTPAPTPLPTPTPTPPPPVVLPVSHDDAAATNTGVSLTVAAPGVLGNDADADGDMLTASMVAPPTHGTLTLNADGSYAYNPAAGFVGTDTFTYRASDPSGSASAPSTVTLTVNPDPRTVLEAAAKAEASAYIMSQMSSDAAAMAGGMMMADSQAALDLVPLDSATSVAIVSGSWGDPNTWLGQMVPGPTDHVWIMPGRTVTVDSSQTAPVDTVRVTGTLQFDPGHNTLLAADTVVVDPSGTLLMGTKASPIAAGVVVQMTFTGNAPIDPTWDPKSLSRGLISLGTAEIHGADVTSWLALGKAPMAGDTTLVLASTPVGWKAGDTLALAGTHYTGTSQTQDERLQIASIARNTVTLTSPLKYDHDVPTQASLAAQFGQAPPGDPLTVQVADLTRNVRFSSANPNVLGDRGHVMFMHTQNESVINAGFYGLGRTDKSVRIGPTNPRGRYALHFHMDGASGTPIVVSGVAVDGSPGWGIDNHSSNVDVTNSVVYGAVGAGFVSEAGDEIGSFRNDLALEATGSPNDNPENLVARRDINDWGYSGHGFWMESPTVTLTGDVAADCHSVGIVVYPLFYEHDGVDLSSVTITESTDNTVYASRFGYYIFNSSPTGGLSKITGLTVFNVQTFAFGLGYSHKIEINGGRLIGQPWAGAVYLDSGTNISYHDTYVVGFSVGLDAGYGGQNAITGGYLDNAVDLRIVKDSNVFDASLGVRHVDISGVTFAGGGVVMDGSVNPLSSGLPFSLRYAPEQITWDGRQLFYNEQAAGLALDSPVPGLDGLTNAASLAGYGLAYAGAVTPAGAAAVAKLSGGLAGPLSPVGPGPLVAGVAYARPGGLVYDQMMYDTITQTYLIKTINASDLVAGWNTIFVTDPNGVRRVGFRYIAPVVT